MVERVRKSWFGRLSKDYRRRIATDLRSYRWAARHNDAFTQNRDFFKVKHTSGIDLKLIGKELIEQHGPIRVLDSGAGYLGVASDFKREFGKNALVTAITLAQPRMSEKWLEVFRKTPRFNSSPHEEVERELRRAAEAELRQAIENAKLVDDLRIGAIENFKIKEPYNLIVDICGPSMYVGGDERRERLGDIYFDALKVGGIVVCDVYLSGFPSTVPEYAKDHNGYYLAQIKTPKRWASFACVYRKVKVKK